MLQKAELYGSNNGDKPAQMPYPGILNAPTLRVVLLRQCDAMTRYALAGGLKVQPELVACLERASAEAAGERGVDIDELMKIHARLADLIAPATPRSVTLMIEDRALHPLLSYFGPLPFVRAFMYVEIGSLILMLATCLFDDVNTQNMQLGLFKSSGWALMKCEAFLLFVSLVGSAFAALFKLQRYISNGTFDPKDSSRYWIQLVLGVISGVVLSQVLYSNQAVGAAPSLLLQQPVLALVGGFSASLVYRILNRLITAVESLFGSDDSDQSPVKGRSAATAKAPAADYQLSGAGEDRLNLEPAGRSYVADTQG